MLWLVIEFWEYEFFGYQFSEYRFAEYEFSEYEFSGNCASLVVRCLQQLIMQNVSIYLPYSLKDDIPPVYVKNSGEALM